MREWEQAGQCNHRKLGGQRERGWGAAAVQQLQQRQPHPPLFIYLVFLLSAAVSYSLPPPVLFKYCSVIVIVIAIIISIIFIINIPWVSVIPRVS